MLWQCHLLHWYLPFLHWVPTRKSMNSWSRSMKKSGIWIWTVLRVAIKISWATASTSIGRTRGMYTHTEIQEANGLGGFLGQLWCRVAELSKLLGIELLLPAAKQTSRIASKRSDTIQVASERQRWLSYFVPPALINWRRCLASNPRNYSKLNRSIFQSKCPSINVYCDNYQSTTPFYRRQLDILYTHRLMSFHSCSFLNFWRFAVAGLVSIVDHHDSLPCNMHNLHDGPCAPTDIGVSG